MNRTHYYWPISLAGVFLIGGTVTAAPDDYSWMDSTNRATLSFRYGLNIKASIKGVGNDFTPGAVPGVYSDGYVLTDSTGNALGYSSYWGYDNASQNNEAGSPANTITFHDPTATGIPSEISGGGGHNPNIGAELTYDRQLWVKENWHDMRIGVEGAINYMHMAFNQDSSYNASVVSTPVAYSYQSGDTPPAAPFQGTSSGSGYMYLQVPPIYPTTAGTPSAPFSEPFTSQDQFSADLWGGRLGPYVEWPLTRKLDLRLSVGFAAALVDANESWSENLTLPGGSSITTSGGGDSLDFMWGGYAAMDATYQLNKRWGVAAGAQFEDLGKFQHTYPGEHVTVNDAGTVNTVNENFTGHQIDLDMRRSIFLELGVSYSF
ncbi:MAG TPA: hypothetical protein VGN23_02060 [Verrucomicrobiae bacterium]|jgi:hypothetical protein